jgi:hypothetical protein
MSRTFEPSQGRFCQGIAPALVETVAGQAPDKPAGGSSARYVKSGSKSVRSA